jgi:hypothetical protein
VFELYIFIVLTNEVLTNEVLLYNVHAGMVYSIRVILMVYSTTVI